jgi:hypothetical protein
MKFFRRIFLCLICLSVSLSCAARNKEYSAAAVNKKQLIAALNNSVFCISVIIKGADYEKRYSVGTGFLIGDGLIASAAHVQTKAEEMPGKFKRPTSEIVAWKKFETGGNRSVSR